MDKDLFLISEDITVIEAMEQIGKCKRNTLFIADNGCLKAAISDGDIRRWILKNGSLDEKICNVANYNPKFLLENERDGALDFMKKQQIAAVPIIDEEGRIVDVITLYEDAQTVVKKEIALPVVIMAGGLGTRLYPYTKILPKPLIPIGDIPIIERIINAFCEYGCNDFYIIVNYKKNMIKAYFNETEHPYNVHFIDEDKPLGTGGGLSLLKGMLDKTFILTNCDILIDADYSDIYRHHSENENKVTMVCSLMDFEVPYGVIDIDEDGKISKMQEKPKFRFLTNTGMYFVEPRVIDSIPDDTVIGFPDVIEKLKKGNENIGIYPVSENSWMDMGQMEKMKRMEENLILK